MRFTFSKTINSVIFMMTFILKCVYSIHISLPTLAPLENHLKYYPNYIRLTRRNRQYRSSPTVLLELEDYRRSVSRP